MGGFTALHQPYDVIFHIGLHKTGTTALQKQWFPKWNAVNIIGLESTEGNTFDDIVCTQDSIYFDARSARQLLGAVLRRDRPNLMSRESLSGSPFAGVAKRSLDHRSDILRNLASAFPESRIVLVIRRQDSYVVSLYRQYLKSGGSLSIREFCRGSRNRRPILAIDRLNYLTYVDFLRKTFSSGVLVLPYELFALDQQVFLRRFAAFVGAEAPGIHVGVRNETKLGATGLKIARFASRLVSSQLNPGGLLPPMGVPWPAAWGGHSVLWLIHDRGLWGLRRKAGRELFGEVKKEIMEQVKNGNRDLDERYALGLKAFAYY